MRKKNKLPGVFETLYNLFPVTVKGAVKPFVISNILFFIFSGALTLQTIVTQYFFDMAEQAYSGAASFWQAASALGVMGAFLIFQQICSGISMYYFPLYIRRAEGAIRNAMHIKTAKIDISNYEDTEFLDSVNKVTENMYWCARFTQSLSYIFTLYVPYFIFMGIYLYALRPILAATLFLVALPVVIGYILQSALLSEQENAVANDRRQALAYEKYLTDRVYFKETRQCGAFHLFYTLYRMALEAFFKKTWRFSRRGYLVSLLCDIITLAGYGGVLYILFDSLMGQMISVGAFAAVLGSVGMMFSLMQEALSGHGRIVSEHYQKVRHLVRFLTYQERRGEVNAIEGSPGICLKNVSFTYPGKSAPAVKEITLDIKPGETLAIVGENGAGKSTLVRLMTGLYLPDSGEVKIGGVSSGQVQPRALYRCMSAVFQLYQKYKMTLGQNVALSDTEEEADGSEILAALKKTNIDADGQSFPQGLETMLAREFGGVDLSGGQWQRIAIARGYCRRHGLILLDEPTATIDPLEETRIYRQFARMSEGKTTILVTHRLGSAKIADRILVLQDGALEDIGTHEELLARGGLYSKMYTTQAKWYE